MNHIEGFRQTMENMVIYGNLAANPGAFNGLATRFNNLESYPNGDTSWQPNVLNGGATSGSTTSLWLIEFGPGKVQGIYPPNTPGGFNIEDLGEVTKENAQSLGRHRPRDYLHQVYRTHFTWFMGMQVVDERCVQRICNINPAILSTNNFDENILIQAKNYLPDNGRKPGNRDLREPRSEDPDRHPRSEPEDQHLFHAPQRQLDGCVRQSRHQVPEHPHLRRRENYLHRNGPELRRNSMPVTDALLYVHGSRVFGLAARLPQLSTPLRPAAIARNDS